MSYSVLYSIVYRARNITRVIVNILFWVFAVEVVVLYGVSVAADVPSLLIEVLSTGTGLRFVTVVIVKIFGTRVFDAVLRRIALRRH